MAFGTALPTLHTPNVGTTFYVDAVNGSDANDGTAAVVGGGHGPWATLAFAYSYLSGTHVWTAAVDIRVYIRAGTYQAAAATTATLDPQFNTAGKKPTSTQWVIWEGYPGDARPVIKPPAGLTGAKYGVRCTSTGGFVADFQRWKGLEFDGEQVVRGDGDVVGIYLSNNTTSNEIIDCYVHGMRANYVANGGAAARKAQGIYIDPNANANYITRNKIYDIGDTAGTILNQEHGIYCSGDNVKIWGNLIYRIPNGYCCQIYDSNTIFTGILIAGNTFIPARSTASSGKSCIVIHGNSTNCTITSNILKNAKEYGIEFFPAASGTGSGNIIDRILYHNDLVGTKSAASPTGWTITNENTADPLFNDPASDNYHITSGSPAIGAGDDTFEEATDLDGVARTSIGDIGVYEFVATSFTSKSTLTMVGVA